MKTFHLFFPLCQRRFRHWKYKNWCSNFENCYHFAKMVDNKFFSRSLLHPVIFQKKKISSWLREDLGHEILPILQWIFTCLKKIVIKTLKQNARLFKLIIKCISDLAFISLHICHWVFNVGSLTAFNNTF